MNIHSLTKKSFERQIFKHTFGDYAFHVFPDHKDFGWKYSIYKKENVQDEDKFIHCQGIFDDRQHATFAAMGHITMLEAKK